MADAYATDGSTSTSFSSGVNADAYTSAVSGVTKATALGDLSDANADIEGTGGGTATSISTAGTFSLAAIIAAGGGDAVATARNKADEANSTVEGGGGKAITLATGAHSDAVAVAEDGGISKGDRERRARLPSWQRPRRVNAMRPPTVPGPAATPKQDVRFPGAWCNGNRNQRLHRHR